MGLRSFLRNLWVSVWAKKQSASSPTSTPTRNYPGLDLFPPDTNPPVFRDHFEERRRNDPEFARIERDVEEIAARLRSSRPWGWRVR